MKAIDLFAGAGGFSTGAAAAGVEVVWAANHWPLAVEVHAANHPGVAHACQDLHQARWETVPDHDLLLASPCCQGHSNARGKDKPHSDASRSTAWAVVSAAEYHRPHFFIVENVEEFRDWVLYPSWCDALRRLGYSLSETILDAADVGVPQERVRLFVVGVRATVPLAIKVPREAHRTARDFVRFDDGMRWAPLHRRGRAEATLARVAAGRRRFGERFLAPFYGSGSGLTGRSLDRPIGTLTTLARWMVVDGERVRMLSPGEALAAMSFPSGYQVAGTIRDQNILIGNAVCPLVAKCVIQQVISAA